MEVKCVYVCVCVHAKWLKGGMAIGVVYWIKAHNLDSQKLEWIHRLAQDLVEGLVMS